MQNLRLSDAQLNPRNFEWSFAIAYPQKLHVVVGGGLLHVLLKRAAALSDSQQLATKVNQASGVTGQKPAI